MLEKIRREYALFVSIFTLVLFEIFQHSLSKSLFGNIFGLLAIFSVVIYSAINVAHHAELLAKKFGEPYGTLILTMSAVTVEVMIISIMMLHAHNPYLAEIPIYPGYVRFSLGLLWVLFLAINWLGFTHFWEEQKFYFWPLSKSIFFLIAFR